MDGSSLPRVSTSGGQSVGRFLGAVLVDEEDEIVEAFWEEVEREVFIMAAQSAEEVQVRQLWGFNRVQYGV